jgi:hypothetical protein
MSEKELGPDFAIHGGGIDLVFPHHENEIAQTEAGRGVPLAEIWMHNGMVQIDEEKMSKSVGNIFQLSEAIDRYGGQTVVAYLGSGHYRQPLAFSDDQLTEAAARVDRIRNYLMDAPAGEPDEFLADRRQAFLDALSDDFNTPQAYAVLFEIVAEGNRRELPGARGGPRGAAAAARARLTAGGGGGGAGRGAAAARRPPGGAAGKGLRARGLAPRPAGGAGLGGPRRGGRRQARAAPSLVAESERIYGRRPVAEAERGRRRVHRIWRSPETQKRK